MKARGDKLAFVGDDTWEQLFPGTFNIALPYPSFNVKDLDTVDDGVWEHLLPLALNRTGDWDVLIAHYLGVDHAGHTFGVQSPQMVRKLHQMDDQISETVMAMVDAAGPGDVHEDTLLLVFGDHGQTLNGDHGGGSDEEVDTALIAFNLGRLHSLRSPPTPAPQMAPQPNSESQLQSQLPVAAAVDEWPDLDVVSTVDQVNLVPTLALMMGLPIPFGNVGSVSEELWGVAEGRGGDANAGSLQRAVEVNAWQVHRYLNTYAATGAHLDPTSLSETNALFELGALSSKSGPEGDGAMAAHQAFLSSAARLARQQWTQFHNGPIAVGISILLTCLAWQAWLAWSLGRTSWLQGPKTHFLDASLLAVAALHAIAIFSNSFVMAEGRMVGFLLAGVLLLFLRARLAFELLVSGRNRRLGLGACGVVCQGLALLGINAGMEAIGLVDRTGGNPFDKSSYQPGGLGVAGWLEKVPMYCALLATPAVVVGARRQESTCWPEHARRLVYSAFSLVIAWWAVHDAGLPISTSLTDLWANCGPPSGWQIQMPGMDLRVVMEAAQDGAAAALEWWPWGNVWQDAFAPLVQMPLADLLPRVVYGLSLTCVSGTVAATAWRHGHPGEGCGLTIRPLVGAVLAPLVLVSGRVGCLVGFLGALQMRLFLGMASTQPRGGTRGLDEGAPGPSDGVLEPSEGTLGPSKGTLGPGEGTLGPGQGSLEPGDRGFASALCVAGVWSLFGTQAFFFSGHFCEFSGLQYNSAFVGFGEFSFFVSGALLALNTLGPHLLAALSLPLAVRGLKARHPTSPPGLRNRPDPKRPPGARASHSAEVAEFRLLAVVYGLLRALTALASVVSVAIQRRHLLVWAVYAPKFVFEACFLLVTDAALVLASWLVAAGG
ncbi:unnamed protein product [Ostreobium quekettii]|uniref:GPI ethanolamine phosphate transferase 3 n=1 Tax=Ostreobium quekettii TaxID=121088 RepID=A0A8S1J9X8_9CHLO|nr:unnamed protein product [Ostreobium quekettii]